MSDAPPDVTHSSIYEPQEPTEQYNGGAPIPPEQPHPPSSPIYEPTPVAPPRPVYEGGVEPTPQAPAPPPAEPQTQKFNWAGQDYDLTTEQVNMLMQAGAETLTRQGETAPEQPIEPQTPPQPEQPQAVPGQPTYIGNDANGQPMFSSDPVQINLYQNNQTLAEKVNAMETQQKNEASMRQMNKEYDAAIESNADYKELMKYPQAAEHIRMQAMVGLYKNPDAPVAQHVANAVAAMKGLVTGVSQSFVGGKAQAVAKTPVEGGASGTVRSEIPQMTADDMRNGRIQQEMAQYLRERIAASS